MIDQNEIRAVIKNELFLGEIWDVTCAGLPIWPLVREQFHYASRNKTKGSYRWSIPQTQISLNSPLSKIGDDNLIYEASNLAFLSRPESCVRLSDGSLFDKYFDSLGILKNWKINKFGFDPELYSSKKFSSLNMINIAERRRKIVAIINLSAFKKWFPISYRYINFDLIMVRIAAILDFSDQIVRYFEVKNIDAVIQTCYYQTIGYSVNHAAHTLGIPSVDFQHGQTSAFHLMANHWVKNDSSPISILPNYFFCWGDISASWFEQSSNASGILAVKGSHPWVELCKSELITSDIKIGRRRNDFILLALQPIENGIEMWVYELLVSKFKHRVLIRFHPHQEQIESHVKQLKKIGFSDENFLYQDLEIHSLLPLVNSLVTAYSTVAWEAANYHKKVILVHPKALEIYDGFLDGDPFYYCETAGALSDQLDEAGTSPRNQKFYGSAENLDFFQSLRG